MRIGEGLVVLVTGNSTDFGEPTIRRLHGMGASLAVLSQDTKWFDVLYATLKVRVLCIQCNVANEEEVKNAVEKTVETFGTIHVAVNC